MSLNSIVGVILVNVIFAAHGNFVLRQPGKLIIGQILPFHKTATSNESQCGELDLERVIEVEALVYAVNKIKSTNPGLELGYDVIDACAQTQMDSAMDTWFQNGGNMSDVPVAIITDFDKESEFFSAQMRARLYSDSERYVAVISVNRRPNVWAKSYNMAPGYGQLYQAVIEVVKRFHWNSLDALIYKQYDDFQNFKKTGDVNGICVLDEIFVFNWDTDKVTDWLQKSQGNASVGVIFAPVSDAVRFVTELATQPNSPQDFVLAFDLLGHQGDWDSGLGGILGIRRNTGNLEDFEEHLRTSKLIDRWFNEVHCANSSSQVCEYSDMKAKQIRALSWRGSSVIDAAYAIVWAGKTSTNGLPKTGLAGVRVTSATGRVVSFDFDRNVEEVKYDVLNFQQSANVMTAVKVGEVTVSKTNKLSLRQADIVWKSGDEPRSRCTADCSPGTYRVPWESSRKCCWDCSPCRPGTVSSYVNSTHCTKCPSGSKPTEDKTKCQPPYFDYLKWHDPFSLVMIFLLAFTVCFLVYTVNLFVKKAGTPVFKGSKVASLPFLLSLFLTFILAVMLMMKPTVTSCGAYTAMFLFCIGIPLTFLITRSHMLHKYCYGVDSKLRRKWCRLNPQTVIGLIFVISQLIYIIIFLNVFPPEVLVFERNGTDVDYIECSIHSRPEFLPYFFFIIALVLLFNILHMNEENTPENQNEVKYMSLAVFNMYILCFIYFVSVYAINGKKKIRIMCAMAYLLGLNFLVFVFLPKVYVILFQPEKNIPDERPLLAPEDEMSATEKDSPVSSPGIDDSGQYERTEV